MLRNFKKRATTVFRKKRAPDTPTDPPPEYDSADNTSRTDNPPFRYTYSTSTNDTDPRDTRITPPAPPTPPAPLAIPPPPSPPAPPSPPPAPTLVEVDLPMQQEPQVEAPDITAANPPADPFARKYVPFVEATPLRNNMLVNAGVYGKVNPAIMSGFGDDSDDDVWLVDDEETDEDEAPRTTLTATQNEDNIDDRSETRSRRSARSHHSQGSNESSSREVPLVFAPPTPRDQVPDAPAPISAQPAFEYARPSLLEDDEFASFSLTTSSTVETSPRPPTPTPVTRRGYAPISASILNLTDLGVGTEEPPTTSTKPQTENVRPELAVETPASSSSSVNPSSENPPAPIVVMPGTF